MNVKIETKQVEELGSVSNIFNLVEYNTLGLKYTNLTDELNKIDIHLTEYNARVEMIIDQISMLQSSKETDLSNYISELNHTALECIWKFD